MFKVKEVTSNNDMVDHLIVRKEKDQEVLIDIREEDVPRNVL